MAIEKNSFKNFSSKKPAVYRIRVQGQLEDSWSERLAGMIITVKLHEDEKPVTTLEGLLTDQAALSGVLNTLYDLHLPVLSVEYVKTETDQEAS